MTSLAGKMLPVDASFYNFVYFYASSNNRHCALTSSIRPSGLCCPFTLISHLLTGRISLKLATNIHYASGRCWKGYLGQRSEVKVILIIVFVLYYYNSYSYLLEGAISCVQMCECYNGETSISTMWHRLFSLFLVLTSCRKPAAFELTWWRYTGWAKKPDHF